MNWKLLFDATSQQAIIQEWGQFRIMRPQQLSPLDVIYAVLEESGDLEGVQRLKDGVYKVHHNGWL